MSEAITLPPGCFRFRTEQTKRSRLVRLFLLTARCSVLTLLLLTAHCSLLTALHAQTVTDKMVASVNNGSRANPDLISYSDLVWQLALEPSRPLVERPTSEDLNHALRLREDQILILQEARKLPIAATDRARQDFDIAVTQKQKELVQAFGSATLLQERLARVGLTSEQQTRNLATLNRVIDLAHARGIAVSLGIWDHIYRAGVQTGGAEWIGEYRGRPIPNSMRPSLM